MDCTSCGRANRTGARFCGGCGASLSSRCPVCGSECEPGARFCDGCGAPLAARAETRKVVTIVFADLMGSTALHERLDPESARDFMERYYAAMRGAVEAERGRVTQLLGDGVKAVFGAPRVAEDDALRAVRAAVAMQGAFRALADAQREAVGAVGLRVAVNTGEVVAQDDREIIGDPVNVAAHLQQQAGDGDVLLGESTERLVAPQVTLERAGTFALKGRAEPVTAWRVVSLERPAGAPASTFVGREDELRRILAVYEAAAGERRARLAVVLGSPGLGKSRLLAELARRLGDAATLLAARCDATGGNTFEPLAEALRAHLCGEAEADRDAVRAAVEAALPPDTAERPRIAAGVAALLAGSPASPEETFFVVRRLLAALAAARPVVLVIDDLHWAEPLLLDLVEHLVQWGGDVPLLVLAAARPELRDRRSSLAAPGGLVADAVTLAGLDAGAATRLAANAIGAEELPAAIAGRVLAASEGNPLFVGELVRMLVQDGSLVREGDRWITRASPADLEMPPTIQALLAARIERLRAEDRTVLERAAVVGRHFSRAAVAELLPAELRGELDARLEALRRSELIEPDTGWLLGEPVLRFHHVLIRDAAYRRLLKGTRAELHARFADWLAARVGDAGEHDEMLGWHLEQAHVLLAELGPLDARGRALGERAASHLAAAGRRALARDDLALASGLLGRALERLAADSPARAELALDWCETLLAAGDVGPAAHALDELDRLAGDSGRLRAWHVCFAAHLAALTDPQALGDTADAVASAAQRLAAEGDAAGEAKAHSVHALVLSRLGRIGASEAALDLALAAARRGGDRRRSNAVLAGAPLAALWGPSPVTRASGRCLDVVRVLRITQGAPAVEAVALRCQGVLEALRGRADAARRMVASSRRLVEELGITQRLLEAELFAGRIELLEGDFAAAERCLRTAFDGLRAQGLDIDAAQAAALLGRALLAQGRADEALALSRESEQLAGDDRIAGIAWRCVRAEALARRGEHAAAVEIAGRAVELGASTDALLDHADARMALATALRAAGRAGEADAEEARAVSLWEAKGATLLVERARVGGAEAAAPLREVSPAPLRRVKPNAATAHSTRLDALVAARDADALASLLAPEAEGVHQPTGRIWDRDGALAALKSLLLAEDLHFRTEALATLGESLGLFRRRVSFRVLERRDVDIGALELDEIGLVEVDAQGRCRREEFFASDRLGDAIARLYARYAELQPEAPARERAAATARSLAVWLLRTDPAGIAGVVAPTVEFVDRRRAGFGRVRGADVVSAGHRIQRELARDVELRVHDVLALCPDAFLLRTMTAGIDRAGGGAFERPLLLLGVFGSDGLVTHIEWFDPDGGAAALARFEALTGTLAATAPRRVRPNAATAGVARTRAGETVEPLATLGDALALYRSDGLRIAEVDGGGLRDESFASDRLGDAIARLYERYAERLPEGPERERAAATARTVANLMAPLELERYAAALAPDVEYVDRRRVGLGSVRGAAGLLRGARTLLETAGDFGTRIDDVLDLRENALLTHGVNFGRGAGGGAYETHVLQVWCFGADGRLERLEEYDDDRLDEARARFDALAGAPAASPRFENAASRAVEQMERRWNERDWDGLIALMGPGFRMDDRRALTGVPLSGKDFLVNLRMMFKMTASRWSLELIATRGESLALLRSRLSGRSDGGGDVAFEHLSLVEVDASARYAALVLFESSDVDAAYAELDRLYAGGEGALHAEVLASLDAFRRNGPPTPQREMERVLADSFHFTSHRQLFSTAAPRTRHEYIADFHDLFALGVDTVLRIDHLRVSQTVLIADALWSGRREDGDFELPMVFVLSHDGRLFGSLDLYDAEQLAEAQARYAELSRASTAPPRIENAATRVVGRMRDAVEALDFPRVTEMLAADFRSVDRGRGALVESGRGAYVGALERMMRELRTSRIALEYLATRGDRLSLSRAHWLVRGDDVGPSEIEWIDLLEVDGEGRAVAQVSFDPGDVDAAYAELDARYAAEAGPAYARIRDFRQATAVRDWDAVRAQCAPDFVMHDHRAVGWEALRGGDAWVGMLRALVELAPDARQRVDHFEMSERGSLMQMTWVGTREGGAFEDGKLIVSEWDPDGRFRRIDQYEVDQLAAARARYAELCAPTSARRIGNLATRTEERACEAFAAHDWDGFAALFAPHFRSSDRRRMMRLELDREQLLEPLGPIFELRPRRTHRVLATRGQHLALVSVRLEAGDAANADSVVEFIQVVEVDDPGLRIAAVGFDPDDVDAAYAELDARFAAQQQGAGRRAALTRAFTEAFAARDWSALAALLAPDLVVNDHRRLGWETLRGPHAYVQALRSLVELAPDVRLRVDHAEMRDPGYLYFTSWQGTREGGAFEEPSWIVCELDLEGRIRRFDQYGLEQEGEAHARLDAIGGAGGARDLLRIPPNAATRTRDRYQRAIEAGDFAAVEALCAPTLEYEDRRRFALTSGDRDMFLASSRMTISFEPTLSRDILATAGDRLALLHLRWRGAPDGASYEGENLSILEVDGDGRIVRVVDFDSDDRRAAAAEMRERFFRGEGARLIPRGTIEALRAWHDHDLARLRAVLPDDFEFHDHRRTGVGRIDGADAYVRSVAALFDQVSDLSADSLYYIALEAHGSLAIARNFGTLVSGSTVESVFVRLSLYRDREFAALELFELEDLESARARFEALRPAAAQPDPLRIPPNAASRTGDRLEAAFGSRDWVTIEAWLAPELVFQDRRRGLLVSVGREMLIANARLIGSSGARLSRTVVATAGDRLALEQRRYAGAGALEFEVESLEVYEVDAEGRVVAVIAFDPEDRRAAAHEMFERYARGEGARKLPRARIEAFRAQNAHDLTTLRALLPAEFTFHDHRRTGLGRLGPDDWLASLAQLFAQAPDLCFETLYVVAGEAHGELTIGRMFGTQITGGDFEGIHVRLSHFEGERLVSTEVFEPEQLDAARARFEALRPDPLRIPPNAATRAMDDHVRALVTHDSDATDASLAPDMTFDDRRRGVLISGDREQFIAGCRMIAATEVHLSRTLLATAGDRLGLEHVRWSGGTAEVGAYETEILSLVEIDTQSRILAIVSFDVDDRRAASLEMFERYARGEGSRSSPPAAFEALRAMNAHDLERLRAVLPEDFVFHDHRRTGLGRLEGADAFVASLAPLFEQATDLTFDALYTIARDDHGELAMARMFGQLVQSGGAVDAVYLRLGHWRAERLIGMELFEPSDLDAARARFEALRPPAPAPTAKPPAPARIEPNAATRAMRRFQACVVARDWHALAELHAPDFIYEDRRPLMRDSGNRDKLVASVRLSAGAGSQSTQTVLATAGNRLSLAHLHSRVSRGSRVISEIEALQVVEVDAKERIVAAISFDPADRAAADAELRARFEAQGAR